MTMSFIVYGSVAAVSLVLLYVIVSLFKTPPAEDQSFVRESEIVPLLDDELKKDLQEKEVLIDDLMVKTELKASELGKIREERDRLRTACATLQSEADANKESIAKKISDANIPLQREIESLKDDRVPLLNQKREAEGRVTAAEEQIISLKAEIMGSQGTLESVKRTLEEERVAYGSLASVVKEKDAVVEDLARKVVSATKDLSRFHSNRATLSEELESTKSELIATKTSIPKRVSQARVVLQRVINTLKEEREELLHQNDEFNKQLASANIDIAKVSKDMENTRRNLEAMKRKAEHSVSRNEIEAIKEANIILEGKAQSLRRELAGVYDSIPAKVRNARAALQEELDASKMENADLQGQTMELEKQLQFFKEESQLLQDSLRNSEDKRTELQRLSSDAERAGDITARELE